MIERILAAIGAWLVTAVLLACLWIACRAWRDRRSRCALCRKPCQVLQRCRFGDVCIECHNAVFRLYHYRAPRLTHEQAKKILKNLWRDVEGYELDG